MDRKTHRTSPYPAEFRERAVQMVVDHLDGYRSLTAAAPDGAGEERIRAAAGTNTAGAPPNAALQGVWTA